MYNFKVEMTLEEEEYAILYSIIRVGAVSLKLGTDKADFDKVDAVAEKALCALMLSKGEEAEQ